MKKFIGFFALTLGVMLIGCSEKPAQNDVTVTPAKTIIIEKEPAASSTTIVLDKNGVKVDAEEIDITVKKD